MVCFFSAHINEYAGKSQFVISGIRLVSEEEIKDKKFYRSAPLSEEELRTKIKTIFIKYPTKF